jgi:predicted DCC family thiol-disulfide oxidoreductase YuxK
LCSGYGEFLKNRNSELVLANQLELEKEDITKDELVYERNNEKFYASEAIVESIYDLGSFFRLVKLLNLFPARLSYVLYKIFANNRYRLN